MDNLLNFIYEYRFILIILCAIIIYALFEWVNFKAECYALMLQAKRYAKDAVLNSGDEQVEWIIRKAYQFLPKYITAFISEKNMRRIIAHLYYKLKDYLDDGKINNSIA